LLTGKSNSKTVSLDYWMTQVPKQMDRAAPSMAADPVHDLRVALRRCRSVAEGMQAIDPHPSWKKMRKAGKQLFSSLGGLRDCHVLAEWTAKIGFSEAPSTQALITYFKQQAPTFQQQVESAFKVFDRRQWEAWGRSLTQRAARVQPGSEAFQCLALERWTEARRLHWAALKTGSSAAFHRLRIALKKFRYIVENFLPELHRDWIHDLKAMQDMLGEIHDLDTLSATLNSSQVLLEPASRELWERRIRSERAARIDAYSQKTTGRNSLWSIWRSRLPRGEQAGRVVLKKLETWASFMRSDSGHSRRTTRFALKLFDELVRSGVVRDKTGRAREVLRAAAVLHDVGSGAGGKNYHKATRRLIRKLPIPFAWKHYELEMAALVAGYHRGMLPRSNHKKLRAVPQAARDATRRLAGILRLAHALDLNHDGAIRRIKVAKPGDYLVVYAEGLNQASVLAEKIAAARHLLETSCRVPVLIRSMPRRSRR